MKEKVSTIRDGYIKNILLVFSTLCLLVHGYFVFFFYQARIFPLVIINVGSVITYISIFFFRGPNKKENQIFVMNMELTVFAVVSSIILSFENGFFLYCFPIPLTSFIEFTNKKRRKILFCSVIMGIIFAIPISILAEPLFKDYRLFMKQYNYSLLLISVFAVMLHFPLITLFFFERIRCYVR